MSTINRGPLGSAFLINREPASSNGTSSGHSTSSGGSATATAPAPEATPAGSIGSKATSAPTPALSSNGAIPMPGPTLSSSTPTAAVANAPAPPPVFAQPGAVPVAPPRGTIVTDELIRSLAEVKGQAQFLLYLADQIEDSLHQLIEEHDDCQNAFLCRILSMYSGQLETKHHGLGDKIAETCQEVYVTVREYDMT